MKKIYRRLAAAIAMSVVGLAQATTYTNVGEPGDRWTAFYSAHYKIGNDIRGIGGVLDDYSFYALAGNSGNAMLMISAWDPVHWKTGATLYSAPISYAGGAQTLTASGIKLTLDKDQQYLVYLSTDNVANPLSQVAFTLVEGSYPYAFEQPYNDGSWINFGYGMVYTANVSAPVPEPESYAMLLAGLAAAGIAVRRKARVAA